MPCNREFVDNYKRLEIINQRYLDWHVAKFKEYKSFKNRSKVFKKTVGVFERVTES